jgi:NTP pyrophosphatase (non-canonical NTP hydrolase)
MATANEINEFVKVCNEAAETAGWWDDAKEVPTHYVQPQKIALIHSEVSEALEGARTDEQDKHLPHRKSLEVELADAVIRIFDFAGHYGLDLGGAMVEKMAYNAQRADHKRENRAAEGGKKF